MDTSYEEAKEAHAALVDYLEKQLYDIYVVNSVENHNAEIIAYHALVNLRL